MPFSATVLSWLVLAALVLAGLAFLVALAALRRAGIRRGRGPRPVRRRPQALPRGKTTPLSSDEVSAEIHRLRRDVSTTLRHMAVVRYDAFGDMGGHLSWSMALLDDGGDGVVLTTPNATPRQLDGDTVGSGKELRARIEPGLLLVRVPR